MQHAAGACTCCSTCCSFARDVTIAHLSPSGTPFCSLTFAGTPMARDPELVRLHVQIISAAFAGAVRLWHSTHCWLKLRCNVKPTVRHLACTSDDSSIMVLKRCALAEQLAQWVAWQTFLLHPSLEHCT